MASGELTPLVMLPRYTALCGEATEGTPDTRFTTIAMDVSDYESAILNVWRGPMPTNTDFEMTCEESTDQATWSDCTTTQTQPYDPGAGAEGQQVATLKKRWFRISIALTQTGGAYPQVTAWVVGFLEERLK